MRKLSVEEKDRLASNWTTLYETFIDTLSILSGKAYYYDLLFNGECRIFVDDQCVFYGTTYEAYAWLNEEVNNYYK